MASIQVSQLFIYPIKSCKGTALTNAIITEAGLYYDRQWMIVRAETGKFMTQRQIPKLALVVPQLPPEALAGAPASALPPDAVLTVTAPGMAAPLTVKMQLPQDAAQRLKGIEVWDYKGQAMDEGEEAAAWFTEYLGTPVRLVRYLGSAAQQQASAAAAPFADTTVRPINDEYTSGFETRFADAYPMLLASESALDDLNARLLEADPSSTPLPIARFRPNIVLSGLKPWEEDAWRTLTLTHNGGGEGAPVVLESVKPCDRCKLTTVDPTKGEFAGDEPLKTLGTFRSGKLMGMATKSFTHSVFFGWNVVSRDVGRTINVGDRVAVAGQQVAF